MWNRPVKKSWRQAVDSLRLRHPKVSIECLSGLFGKTREGYYSISRTTCEERKLNELKVLSLVKGIRQQAPGIGAYKLFLILRDVYGARIMGRECFYNLLHRRHLMLPPQKRRHTTDSDHRFRRYKNLIKDYKPTGINKLWVADITYIDTDEGVCYLHLLTDEFTHEIIGWTLSESLVAENTLEALEQAVSLFRKTDLSHLIHHSDRGAQYCCNRYVERLQELKITISMTEDGNPTDNAIAERVNGIIKQEWLYRMKRPANIKQARTLIKQIIE